MPSLINLPTFACVFTTESRIILLKARDNAAIMMAMDVGPAFRVGCVVSIVHCKRVGLWCHTCD